MKSYSPLFLSTLLVLSTLFFQCTPPTQQERLQEAEEEFKYGSHELSLQMVNELLIEDSNHVEAHELRGKILFTLRDTLGSEDDFNFILSLPEPESFKSQRIEELIDWEIDHHHPDQVKKLLLRDLALYKEDVDKHLGIVRYAVKTFLDLNAETDARNLLDSTLTNAKGHPATVEYVFRRYLQLRDTSTALNALKQTIKEHPKQSKNLKLLADFDFKGKRYRSAARIYRKYIQLKEKDSDALFHLGVCYLENKQKSLARKYFKQARDLGHKAACQNYRELTAKTKYSVYSRCCDGTRSSSTGRGTCSHHGGVCRTEYEPYKEYTVDCR